MLRLPSFDVVAPTTVDEVVAALATPGARLVAGGTDILPNLKHRLDRPPLLVQLSRVRELQGVRVDGDLLRVGAGNTLTEVAEDALVRRHAPSLAKAAGLVAGPLHRNMGTLGGNVNLDTRCRYVNQTAFWRSAIGGCLKSEGDVCHVVPKGRNCVAAMSSDTVPVLCTLQARLLQVGPAGAREVPVLDYFGADGREHLRREPGEVTAAILVPLATRPRRADYVKWTVRGAIDFPLVSVALCVELSRDAADAEIEAVRVVVGVLGSKPREVTRLEDVHGRRLDDPEVAELVAERVHAQCKPLPNVPYEAPYRRHMLRVLTRRGFAGLATAGG